jgi:hypothetical protein
MMIETSIVIDGAGLDFAADVRRGIAEAATDVHRRAVESIQSGSKSGRVYSHYFVTIKGRAVPIRARGKPHQASAPGEAPASDSGALASSISFEVRLGGMAAEIGSERDYGLFLEEGTDKVAARPWLKPAADENTVVDAFVRAFRRAG